MIVAFTLSMSRVGSWNGRWTGENKTYAKVRQISKDKAPGLVGSYSYAWSDGWSARVDVKIIDGREAARLRKKSSGFCGYEWMIDNIIQHGKIRGSNETL